MEIPIENIASPRKRFFGMLIDQVVLHVLIAGYIIAFGESNDQGAYVVKNGTALPIIGLWLVYFPIIESVTGQTLGKKLMGTRIAKPFGQEVTFGDSFVRHFFNLIDVYLLAGIFVIVNTDKRQRVGDLVAKTIVIEDKSAVCEKCNAELTLSVREASAKRFTCPTCKHENVMEGELSLTKG